MVGKKINGEGFSRQKVRRGGGSIHGFAGKARLPVGEIGELVENELVFSLVLNLEWCFFFFFFCKI